MKSTVLLNVLYKVDALSMADIQRHLNASVWVDSGSVDIYASDSSTQPSSIASMTLSGNDTGVSGKRIIEALPTYMALVQNAGSSSEIVLSGVGVTDLGGIS